ncbi:hypothetical protein ACFL2O_01745 [Thermodesulfobacteriota bacterium]
MKNKVIWSVLGFVLLLVFIITFMRTPEEIANLLTEVSGEVRNFSAFVHLAFLAVIIFGLIFKKARNHLFSFFIAFLSLSATVIAVRYAILPNIIIFAVFFILIVHAYIKKKLNFDFSSNKIINSLFGITAMVFGFWYLHWVEDPVWLNALLYSPLGVVNCPTMLTVTGFLCLSEKPRSVMLEATVALTTLYFGFFGVFRLGAYVDVTMIICALFLILRLGSYLNYKGTFEN